MNAPQIKTWLKVKREGHTNLLEPIPVVRAKRSSIILHNPLVHLEYALRNHDSHGDSEHLR